MTPDNFALAVCTDDAKSISKANGIGAKTAARIILELKDKITVESASPAIRSAGAAAAALPKTGNIPDALDALMMLGYDKNSASKALSGLDPKKDAGELVRLALKTFAK